MFHPASIQGIFATLSTFFAPAHLFVAPVCWPLNPQSSSRYRLRALRVSVVKSAGGRKNSLKSATGSDSVQVDRKARSIGQGARSSEPGGVVTGDLGLVTREKLLAISHQLSVDPREKPTEFYKLSTLNPKP